MNKFTIFGGAALVALAGAAIAQDEARPRFDRNADVTRQQVIEHVDQRFARLDLDNDGRATAEEARQAHQQRRAEHAGRMFDRMDANDDGSVSRAEFDQARAQRAERRAGAGEHRGMRHGRRGMHGMRGGHGAMFGEQGFITLEQMRARALERFDRADANRDGTLTADERRQAREQRREERRDRRG